MDRLIQDMESGDPQLRIHAAFAVGWEGNVRAAIPLIERLYDGDRRVQQTAVSALSNLREDKIIHLLLERLERGPLGDGARVAEGIAVACAGRCRASTTTSCCASRGSSCCRWRCNLVVTVIAVWAIRGAGA